MDIKSSPLELIGNTPLILARNIMQDLKLKNNIYLKLEKFNLTGSSKDRLVKTIIEQLLEEKTLNTGMTIIEATSGNTGISLACLCKIYKLKAIIVMPKSASEERIKIIRSYGGKVILTKDSDGMAKALIVAEALKHKIDNSILLSQFTNPLGIMAHYSTTGEEIKKALNGSIDYFVAGIGTGTTLTGVAKSLKEYNKNIKSIGVVPSNHNHKIQGIGPNFKPPLLDDKLVDEKIYIDDKDAYYWCKQLCIKESLLCGISSGAALAAAIKIALNSINQNKNIVVLLPDDGQRYISTGVFEDAF